MTRSVMIIIMIQNYTKLTISGPNENSQEASISVYVYDISGPNENSQKASISVYVLAACNQDGFCVNEHQNTRPERSLENSSTNLKNATGKLKRHRK